MNLKTLAKFPQCTQKMGQLFIINQTSPCPAGQNKLNNTKNANRTGLKPYSSTPQHLQLTTED